MAERDGVRVGFSSSGGLKASGPRNALAKWLPELKAMKPAILNAMVADPADAYSRALLRELPSTQCPDGFSSDRWAAIRDGAERFAGDWTVTTMSLGWTFEELFDLREPFANVTIQGAAWFVGGSTVTAVTADAITLLTEGGATQRIYRKQRA
jgi:hypothetical protein